MTLVSESGKRVQKTGAFAPVFLSSYNKDARFPAVAAAPVPALGNFENVVGFVYKEELLADAVLSELLVDPESVLELGFVVFSTLDTGRDIGVYIVFDPAVGVDPAQLPVPCHEDA